MTDGFPSLEKINDLKEDQFTKFYDFLRMSIIGFPLSGFIVLDPFKNDQELLRHYSIEL